MTSLHGATAGCTRRRGAHGAHLCDKRASMMCGRGRRTTDTHRHHFICRPREGDREGGREGGQHWEGLAEECRLAVSAGRRSAQPWLIPRVTDRRDGTALATTKTLLLSPYTQNMRSLSNVPLFIVYDHEHRTKTSFTVSVFSSLSIRHLLMKRGLW